MYNALMILCLVLIMFGSVAGCSQNQQDKIEETVVENSVMTSAFYEGIDSVELVGADVIIDDKEVINEIKNYILSLEVTESEKNISDYYGNTTLVFKYEDGSTKSVIMTSELIYDMGETYCTNKDVCSVIREKFN